MSVSSLVKGIALHKLRPPGVLREFQKTRLASSGHMILHRSSPGTEYAKHVRFLFSFSSCSLLFLVS